MSQLRPSRKMRQTRPVTGRLPRSCAPRRRPGSILLAVTVVLALLALAAYSFADMMILDAQATQAYGRTVQASLATDSGLEYLSSIVGDRTANASTFYNDPAQFQGVTVLDGGTPASRMRFSVIAPGDSPANPVRFGLIDESAKLNVNVIPQLIPNNNQSQRQMLIYLPNMTNEIADAILDWVDSDSTRRETGVESEYYSTLSPSYVPTNGPAASLDELLLVKGVTRELLFGEDANFNGMLDANENDGDASMPPDNSDGVLD
ncbi:MAG TPA: hypothetical protein VHB77_02765, partial [Planctomycetaceae bacterium]|nr:hypothetical protein [Planctomycetaceae bacterium]